MNVSKLIAFPNPAVNQIRIYFSESHKIPSTLYLLDLEGKVVMERKEGITIETILDVTNVAPGTYLLKAGNSTQKVVVE